MATATYVKTDSSTEGEWVGVYGSDGYEVVPASGGDFPSSAPSYLSGFTMSASAIVGTYNWTDNDGSSTGTESSAVTQALEDPANLTGGRWAITWYDSGNDWLEATFDVGSAPRQVAVYFLDGAPAAPGGRTATVTVIDADSLATLDTQLLASFQLGKWLVWTITGHVSIRTTNTGPVNPVISALMFDTIGQPFQQWLPRYGG